MRIGKVVEITGMSKDTIRFYEKFGLIKVSRTKSDWNNYRDYDENNLNKLLLIKKAKSFGFTLNEISEIIILLDTNVANCTTLSNKANNKLIEIDRKINELKSLGKYKVKKTFYK